MKLSQGARVGLSVGVFVVLAVLQTPAEAQVSTNGSGPYYATPSWDQKITTGRFVVLSNWNNEAVLDRETGLVWEKTPSTFIYNYYNASVHCLNLNIAGRTGWHLPTLQELMSLVDRSQNSPALPSGHPFTAQNFYWSSTDSAENAAFVWEVSINNGGVGNQNKSTAIDSAWCVRGGQGAAAQ